MQTELILDFGSGNTCQNDEAIIKQMVDQLARVDQGRCKVIIKWQLFKSAPPNAPLWTQCFRYAYDYGTDMGYQVTASVFDDQMLTMFLGSMGKTRGNRIPGYSVPFLKIACRDWLWHLIAKTYPNIPIYASYSSPDMLNKLSLRLCRHDKMLACIPKYPADLDEYAQLLRIGGWDGVSDHTVGWDLYHWVEKELDPPAIIWEKHYKLENSTGPDAGPFAVTPKDLEEIL